ncbi:MAG: hypothetical protein U1E38_07870 [Rhodospirillales bacterium]
MRAHPPRPSPARTVSAALAGLIALAAAACTAAPRPAADPDKRLPVTAYTAPGAVAPTLLKASELLPAELRKGDTYEVDEAVRNDGLINTYTLNSPYGRYEVKGDDQLRYHENELEVLGALEEYGVSQPVVFGLGVVNGAENYVEGGAQLIVYPARAIANVPIGFWNYSSQVAEMTRSRRTFYEDSYAEELIGFSQAKREFAGRTGVDPYTTNEAMQERLNALSWPSWGGGILATIGTVPVAGIAGFALTGASLPESMHLVNLDKAPEDLRIENRRRLKEMGVEEPLREAFLSHPWYSPRHQTIIVGSLYSLKQASGRPSFIAAAMAAGSEQDAFTMQRTAELLRAFDEYASPLTEVAAPQGLIVARAADGATVVPLYADRGVWTSGTQALADAWDRDAAAYPTASRKVLWVSGRLSPQMAEAVRQRGWLVEERIFERHLLAYEYQEQMAIKESLMGERIFPRIGD